MQLRPFLSSGLAWVFFGSYLMQDAMCTYVRSLLLPFKQIDRRTDIFIIVVSLNVSTQRERFVLTLDRSSSRLALLGRRLENCSSTQPVFLSVSHVLSQQEMLRLEAHVHTNTSIIVYTYHLELIRASGKCGKRRQHFVIIERINIWKYCRG